MKIAMGLCDTIQDKSVRTSIAKDCAQLMDKQVAAKSGISGMALKAAYKVIKGVGAGYIPRAISHLLPDTCAALEPLWNEGIQAGDPVEYLAQNRSIAADQILSVTDSHIEKSKNKVVRSSYNMLRKSVKNDVEEAVPGLAEILGNYAVTEKATAA